MNLFKREPHGLLIRYHKPEDTISRIHVFEIDTKDYNFKVYGSGFTEKSAMISFFREGLAVLCPASPSRIKRILNWASNLFGVVDLPGRSDR